MDLSLDDVCEFINGGAWSDDEYADEGIRVVKVTNMRNGTISDEGLDHLPASKYEKYKRHELRPNDLVVATVGSHPNQPGSVVGRTSRIPASFGGAFLNQNAACLRVKRPDLVDQRFLCFLSETVLFKHHIESRARGSANQVRMAIGDLRQFTISYPPLPTQRKIAAVLAAYDDLIEANRRRIALLERMAEEIYREWFVRLRFPGHATTKITKGIPAGWEIKRLGEVASILMGQSPSSEFYNEKGEGLPFHQGVGTYGERYPKHDIFCSEKGRMARKGDILFSVRAPVGRLNIADRDLIIGRGISAVTHREKAQSYLFYKLRVLFAKEDVIGNGAIFNAVGKDELLGFQMIEPGGSLIEKYEEIAAPIDRQIEVLGSANAHLTRTRDLLLPRLISGKLPVESLPISFPPSMADAGK